MTSAADESNPRNPAQIKAVCLDIDDTLIDSQSAARSSLRELLGTDRAWPVWQRTTDRYYGRFVSGQLPFDVMCVERTRAFFAAFGEHIDHAEAQRRENQRMAAMQRAWGLFDDVAHSLDWMRATGLRLAVVTNAPGDYQRKKLAAVGLADAFDTVVISGETGVAKPDPRIFHTACQRLGLQPHEVAHVGDRLTTDAQGATRAGLLGIWLNRDQIPAPRAFAEDVVPTITGLGELPELLVTEIAAPHLADLVGHAP
ncbi:HAD family hydrolase [Saccharopolyspora mangrovi]|uniref:HAD family hydrolase n=1 Tax=Saccharopolyspora mangrovi TaxID=3082379 RepID=A0ABU6A5M0_9PSEU|nr:HAD family hydrolase [Saccharopolyspora sp. S2-29]MEB3366770.1 HAD family hydrolase [Saccharopolyspora sp. S2-29]